MGERKGQNKYYPPDFDPAKHGSLNGYHGTHALRERAKRLKTEGVLIIRFEMPYNIWCDGCKQPIGMGVRYNAEKTKIGYYYSTPIFKFRMKCAMCDQYFEIKTDPQHQDYVIISGARRKEQRWDATQNEQVVPEERETHKKLVLDPMFALEHQVDDKQKRVEGLPTLDRIENYQKRWRDDYSLNKILRNKFRAEKKELKATEAHDKALLDKSSLEIALVPETADDRRLAELMKLYDTGDGKSYEERQLAKRKSIENSSLFLPNKAGDKSFSTTKDKSSVLSQFKALAYKSELDKASCSLSLNDTPLSGIVRIRKHSVNLSSTDGESTGNQDSATKNLTTLETFSETEVETTSRESAENLNLSETFTESDTGTAHSKSAEIPNASEILSKSNAGTAFAKLQSENSHSSDSVTHSLVAYYSDSSGTSDAE